MRSNTGSGFESSPIRRIHDWCIGTFLRFDYEGHTTGRGMADRQSRPRPRPQRPLGTRPEGPRDRWDPPVRHEQGWVIPAKLGQRLYEKSKLGQRLDDGRVVLSPEEVLFCHWNRHLSLPSEHWLEESLAQHPDLLQRAVILDVARSGGEVLVLNSADSVASDGWGLRWSRHDKPPAPPVANADWASSGLQVDWPRLLNQVMNDDDQGLLTERYIIDEELDVTMYHVHPVNFSGALTPWQDLTDEVRTDLEQAWTAQVPCGEGVRLPLIGQAWPWPQVGTTHASGRQLNAEETAIFAHVVDGASLTEVAEKAHSLMSLGIMLRPGFKYGCRWRAYDDDVDVTHAPWLVQTEDRRPVSWEEVCLAVRLAEGVNKIWVTEVDDQWLAVRRALPGRPAQPRHVGRSASPTGQA